MKLLGNPLVVGLLAVAALALVIRNFVWPLLPASKAGRPSAAAATPDVTTPISIAIRATQQARELTKAIPDLSAPAYKAASAAMGAEVEVLKEDAERWREMPRRDPFQIRQDPEGGTTTPRPPPASELLTLGGIWRQTGDSLATINQRMVREGDSLLGFIIQKIDRDRVWVQGTNGLEALEFKVRVEGSANAFPKTSPTAETRAPRPMLLP